MPGLSDFSTPAAVPPVSGTESHRAIFLRFLRFGLLAWGGPVAQIAMIRQELVEQEQWIDTPRFNRVLGVYQALPGPEAHELCVYFGHVRAGRIGGFLAGLGFMLPGFLLMFALSWIYVTYGVDSAPVAALFHGFAPAVAALVVRAVHRIGSHSLLDRWLWAIAICCGAAQLGGVHFALPLLTGGVAYALASRGLRVPAIAVLVVLLAATAFQMDTGEGAVTASGGTGKNTPSMSEVAASGLRTGLLTFGGAYTAIPFLQHDAVVRGDWMTQSQFVDGLALASALPAPLIIFSTFVGYVGGGPLAALLITAAVFAPAFAFTLIGHGYVERAVNDPRLHAFLDGVTAAVVGFIAVVAATLLDSAITGAVPAGIFVLALALLWRWKSRMAIVTVMLASGTAGVVGSIL